MKKILMLSMLVFATSLFASKIAIVDMQRVLTEVKQGKAAMEILKTEAQKKEKEMKSKQDVLISLQKEIETLMSNPAADKEKILQKQKEGQAKLMTYQKEAKKIQDDLSEREQKAAADILRKSQPIILSISKKESFDVILNKAAIIYAPESLDITNEVIRKYDEANK
ncbi:OmpH family outer membrane protein [bacterium]|nr:OmpH family outer membrane protein [bacterium]